MQGSKSTISQSLVTIPVNLQGVYDLAAKISSLEAEHRYIEKHVLNLIVAFSGVSREKLPPMSDMQFKFGSSMSWRKTDIREKIIGLLSSYISSFRVDGTSNYERIKFDSELKQRLYDSSIIPVANSSFADLSAYFTYLDFWPVYFDLNCKGEKCTPSSANSLLSFFGIQDYRFTYDLSFPTLVQVKDPLALNSRGYTFNFFLEANIRNNKPMPANFVPFEKEQLSENSQLCDLRSSGNVTVFVTDLSTRKPVEGAQVLYTVTGESCFIGSTNQEGIMKGEFPVGIGGGISVVKQGYIGKAMEFDPKTGKDGSLKLKLSPVYTKNIVVRKKNVQKSPQGWQFVDSPSDLSQKEEATITLTRISDGEELEFTSVANYEGGKSDSTIEVAPGDYTLDATLLLSDRIVIPEQKRCISKFFGKECYTMPKIDFAEKASPGQERFPEGGVKLNITINPQDLEKHNTIVFYVVSLDFAGVPEKQRVVEDIEQINKVEEYSNTYDLALGHTYK